MAAFTYQVPKYAPTREELARDILLALIKSGYRGDPSEAVRQADALLAALGKKEGA